MVPNGTVALVDARRASEVLRESPAGTTATHAALSRMVSSRQLRLRREEEETEEGTPGLSRGPRRYLERASRVLEHTPGGRR